MTMKRISTILLLLVAALCILPFVGSCQEFDSPSWSNHLLSKPAYPDSLIGDSITFDNIPTGERNTHTHAVDSILTSSGISTAGISILSGRSVKTKTDTILVEALCRNRIESDGNGINLYNNSVSIKWQKLERQLEWRQRGQTYCLSDSFSWYSWTSESQWVTKSSRWLIDPKDICYQLIPLNQEK